MPSPIRLAFVAALAAFALGACSGGGGMTTPTTGGMTPAPSPTPTPAPTPSTPTAGDKTDYFPIRAAQVTWGLSEGGASTGTRLENIDTQIVDIVNADTPGEFRVTTNFHRFSEFEFGAPETDNGIPLEKATATAAGRYAVIAYQGILEHSMFLIQGGAVTNDMPQRLYTRNYLYFTTGNPTTGAPVAGTWTGKAVAVEYSYNRPDAITLAEAESVIVQGDVEIGVTLNGSDQNFTWAFTNWTGGSVEGGYPDITHEGFTLAPEGTPPTATKASDHYFVYSHPYGTSDPSRRWTNRALGIQFYGPGRQEVGGLFSFEWSQEVYWLQGVFAAKKQP